MIPITFPLTETKIRSLIHTIVYMATRRDTQIALHAANQLIRHTMNALTADLNDRHLLSAIVTVASEMKRQIDFSRQAQLLLCDWWETSEYLINYLASDHVQVRAKPVIDKMIELQERHDTFDVLWEAIDSFRDIARAAAARAAAFQPAKGKSVAHGDSDDAELCKEDLGWVYSVLRKVHESVGILNDFRSLNRPPTDGNMSTATEAMTKLCSYIDAVKSIDDRCEETQGQPHEIERRCLHEIILDEELETTLDWVGCAMLFGIKGSGCAGTNVREIYAFWKKLDAPWAEEFNEMMVAYGKVLKIQEEFEKDFVERTEKNERVENFDRK